MPDTSSNPRAVRLLVVIFSVMVVLVAVLCLLSSINRNPEPSGSARPASVSTCTPRPMVSVSTAAPAFDINSEFTEPFRDAVTELLGVIDISIYFSDEGFQDFLIGDHNRLIIYADSGLDAVHGILYADDSAVSYLGAVLSVVRDVSPLAGKSEARSYLSSADADGTASSPSEYFRFSVERLGDFYYFDCGLTFDPYFETCKDEMIAYANDNTALLPMSFSGSGDDVLILDAPVSGYVISVSGNEASRHFAVTVYSSDGSSDLVVNTVDPYSGTVTSRTDDIMHIEITSTGDWTIDLIPFDQYR